MTTVVLRYLLYKNLALRFCKSKNLALSYLLRKKQNLDFDRGRISDFESFIFFSLVVMNDITTAQALFTSSDAVNTGFSITGAEIDPSIATLAQTPDINSLFGLTASHQISEVLPMFAGLDDARIVVF